MTGRLTNIRRCPVRRAGSLVFAAALVDSGVAPPQVGAAFDAQVMSDAAIDERIDLALRALAA